MLNSFNSLFTKIKNDASLFRWSFQYVSMYWKRIVFAIALTLIMSFSNGVATYSILPIMQVALEDTGIGQQNIGVNTIETPVIASSNTSGLVAFLDSQYRKINPAGTRLTRLITFAIISLLLLLITNILRATIDAIFIIIQSSGVKKIRSDAFRRLSRSNLVYFNKRKGGEITSRITNDLAGSIGMVTSNLSVIVMNFIMILVLLVLLIGTSIKLTLVAMPIILTAAILSTLLANWIRILRIRLLKSNALLVTLIQEFLAGVRIIKAFGKEQYEISKWEKEIEWWRRYEIKNNLAKILMPRGITLALALAVGAIFISGSILLMNNELGVGQLILFTLLLQRIQPPITGLLDGYTNIQNGLAYSERSQSIFSESSLEETGSSKISGIKDGVILNNVSFTYGEANVISDLTLKLPVNSVTAVVGPSGSGKSTLADLLIRFYDPTKGLITIDGTDIRKFKLDQYRSLFGVVTQDTFLFNDTIKNNIAYGIEDIDDTEILNAAKTANANEFISQLHKGYETIIGDRGVLLSGGERQRLAIARAILKNPPMLILDEATSALDTESERRVEEAINRVIKGRTVLVIAHRLSTIQRADNIVVISNGIITESGTHSELIDKMGLYKHLYDMQFISTS